MIIRYKKIEHERLEDAPFVGALISAIDCKFGCEGCFNQQVKDLPTLQASEQDIIKEVKNNPFNKGIILAGLEWTLQFDEAVALAIEAHKQGLQTMLYTGCSLKELGFDISDFDYIKCGRYIQKLESSDNVQYGVRLASCNQVIYKKRIIWKKHLDNS